MISVQPLVIACMIGCATFVAIQVVGDNDASAEPPMDTAANGPASTSFCDISKCPWHLWAHYREKGCDAVYDDKACCPTHFDCSTSFNQSSGCIYEGRSYPKGGSVTTPNNCMICSCRSLLVGEDVYADGVDCIGIECPEMIWTRPGPGCHGIYSQDRCCAEKIECNENVTQPICEHGGRKYYDKQKMYFDGDDLQCQTCICSPEYEGPFGPGCRTMQCVVDVSQRSYRKGCVPAYPEKGCCPWGWHCPPEESDSSRTVNDATAQDLDTSCKFGDEVYQLGHEIQTNKTCVTCSCSTPPEITCIQKYRCYGDN